MASSKTIFIQLRSRKVNGGLVFGKVNGAWSCIMSAPIFRYACLGKTPIEVIKWAKQRHYQIWTQEQNGWKLYGRS